MTAAVGSAEYIADQPDHRTQSEHYRTQRTLALNDEGFVLRSTSRDPCSVGLATPLDELTGLPLPIVVIEPRFKNANTDFADFHHSFHPERDLIHADDALLALRRSRGQILPRWLHEHYHKYFAGPEFPETRQATFTTVVLACAGVVPPRAIDFSDGEPRIVEPKSNVQQQVLAKSVRHEADKNSSHNNFYRAQIGMFFANYAIEQSIEEVVSSHVIDEFLETKSTSRRMQLGNLLLREGIRLSVEPLVPVHNELKRQGRIARRQTDLHARVHDFFVRSRRKDYHIALEKKWRSDAANSAA